MPSELQNRPCLRPSDASTTQRTVLLTSVSSMLPKLLHLLTVAAYMAFIYPVHAEIGDTCDGSAGTGSCSLKSDCTDGDNVIVCFDNSGQADALRLGFTIKGACPNDPANVLCCIRTSCSYSSQIYTATSGNCYDINTNSCMDGFYVQDQCPGGNNVQCCIWNSLVFYLHDVYDKAVEYLNSHPNARDTPNELVLGWLRHPSYDNIQWTALIRGIDQTWIQYAENQALEKLDTFTDPKYAIEVELNHLGASLDGAFNKGTSHAGDVSGWGGDFITFYGDWRAQLYPYPDGHDFAMNVLASDTKDSTFKLLDLIEDADAFNLAKIMTEYPQEPIYNVFNYYYRAGGGYASRFATFYQDRFGANAATAQAVAKDILTTGDLVIASGRTLLIESRAKSLGQFPVKLPSQLSSQELGSFTKGFADIMAKLAASG